MKIDAPLFATEIANVPAEARALESLASQVKVHIEKRFGASWSRPVARMPEFVLAVRD